MIQDAGKLAERGAIGLVLECIPEDLGKLISEAIDIPTIGIGAGLDCDGQVLVYHDILQYGVERLPKFVDRKSTRLNSSHVAISYAVFCLKKKILLCHLYL